MPARSQARATKYFCNVTLSQLQSSCFCEFNLPPGNLSKASPGYVLKSIVWLNVQLQYKSYQNLQYKWPKILENQHNVEKKKIKKKFKIKK
jgi:hypothetical protein